METVGGDRKPQPIFFPSFVEEHEALTASDFVSGVCCRREQGVLAASDFVSTFFLYERARRVEVGNLTGILFFFRALLSLIEIGNSTLISFFLAICCKR